MDYLDRLPDFLLVMAFAYSDRSPTGPSPHSSRIQEDCVRITAETPLKLDPQNTALRGWIEGETP